MNNRVPAILLVAAWLSMLPNLGLHEFKFEESLRAITSYEMVQNHDFVQPTFLGDAYYKKPPLFNWLTIASAQVFGWTELAVRALSVCATVFTSALLYFFARRTLADNRLAVFAALIYATFFDVLFFYGFIGEIDATFSLFAFAMMAAQYVGFVERRGSFIIAAGVLAGLAFMLKGLPAYVFFALSYASMVVFEKRWRFLLSPAFLSSLLPAVAIPLLWIVQTADPQQYLATLFSESTQRVEASGQLRHLGEHLVAFPLENFKQLAPASLFLALLALPAFGKRGFAIVRDMQWLPTAAKLALLIIAVNYLPYLISAGSRGRYIMPLLPFVALVFACIFLHAAKAHYLRWLVATLGVFIVLRILLGFFVIPEIMAHKQSSQRAAQDIIKAIDTNKRIACDCSAEKSVCLYVDLYAKKYLKKSARIPDWDYNISCSKQAEANALKSYPLDNTVYLFAREKK